MYNANNERQYAYHVYCPVQYFYVIFKTISAIVDKFKKLSNVMPTKYE